MNDFTSLYPIHITGTKGKGSTSAFCESILRHLQRPPLSPFKIKTGKMIMRLILDPDYSQVFILLLI